MQVISVFGQIKDSFPTAQDADKPAVLIVDLSRITRTGKPEPKQAFISQP